MGVQRGISLFQRERSEIVKGVELLISAKELHWRGADFSLPITAQ
jgi:hypothetical protein